MTRLVTHDGYDFYEMLSMMQKAIRRNDYQNAGFAANQLCRKYRGAMWNRLLVISAEDCFGVITKEIVNLRELDQEATDDACVSRAVALLCENDKSRDGCYFSCNFVLASRQNKIIRPDMKSLKELYMAERKVEGIIYQHDIFDEEIDIFDDGNEKKFPIPLKNLPMIVSCYSLHKALEHRDMDGIGYEIDYLRRTDRNKLWIYYWLYAQKFGTAVMNEIGALARADKYVNGRRPALEKDEIFISKAAMILSYAGDPKFNTDGKILGSRFIPDEDFVDWSVKEAKPISECHLGNEGIPSWVYDCHTIKGKKMGKTDWDMNTTEGEALTPLREAYFEKASWLYTYDADFRSGHMADKDVKRIYEFAKCHPVNPVKMIEYKAEELL